MSREQSDDKDSAGETRNDQFVDASAETEVELRLPLEVDMEPDQIHDHVPTFPGPPIGAKPKWPRQGLSLPLGNYRVPEHYQ